MRIKSRKAAKLNAKNKNVWQECFYVRIKKKTSNQNFPIFLNYVVLPNWWLTNTDHIYSKGHVFFLSLVYDRKKCAYIMFF